MNDTQEAAPEEKGRSSSKAASIPREQQDPEDVLLDGMIAAAKRALAKGPLPRKQQLPKKK